MDKIMAVIGTVGILCIVAWVGCGIMGEAGVVPSVTVPVSLWFKNIVVYCVVIALILAFTGPILLAFVICFFKK